MAKYCEKMKAAIEEGHLVKLPPQPQPSRVTERMKPVYYIPHFNTDQKKFNVVYDATREFHGVSLLAKGPIFMQTFSSILLRFGEKKYGLASELRILFFQIRIHSDDRDMLRILWFDQPDLQGDIVRSLQSKVYTEHGSSLVRWSCSRERHLKAGAVGTCLQRTIIIVCVTVLLFVFIL